MTAGRHSGTKAGRLCLVPLLMSVPLMAVGGWVTYGWLGRSGVEAMLAAQMLVLIIVCATSWPIARRASAVPSSERLRLTFKAAGQRFVLTLMGSGLVVWRGNLDRSVFLVWVAISYIILIKAETIVLVVWLRRLEKSP